MNVHFRTHEPLARIRGGQSRVGFEGQGSTATSGGKVIADTKLPLDAFTSFVRSTNGAMPPFSAKMVSDADLADIYAYLESRPQPKSAKDIPLLGASLP